MRSARRAGRHVSGEALRETGDKPWRVLCSIYVAALLSANAMAAKLISVAGVAVTAGALAIPVVFVIMDIVNELYGPRAARQLVWMGFIANTVLVAFILICWAVPASPLGVPEQAFDVIFLMTPRVVGASMCAYLTSSLVDVRVFHAIRRLTDGRHFWLRKNVAPAVSQLVDATIFLTLAFGGFVPWRVLPGMILAEYLVKVSAAPIGTPISYAVVAYVR